MKNVNVECNRKWRENEKENWWIMAGGTYEKLGVWSKGKVIHASRRPPHNAPVVSLTQDNGYRVVNIPSSSSGGCV